MRCSTRRDESSAKHSFWSIYLHSDKMASTCCSYYIHTAATFIPGCTPLLTLVYIMRPIDSPIEGPGSRGMEGQEIDGTGAAEHLLHWIQVSPAA